MVKKAPSKGSASPSLRRYAAIIDNGCVYDRARRQGVPRANYGELPNIIRERVGAVWHKSVLEQPLHFCTSAPTVTDERFSRFVTNLEEIGFNVYATKGAPAYVKDLRTLVDEGLVDRVKVSLQRQDALVGYLVGRLVESHDIVAVSDSAGVVHTLTIAAMKRKSQTILMAPKSILAPAILETIERCGDVLKFIDLDADAARLFSGSRRDESDTRFLPTI